MRLFEFSNDAISDLTILLRNQLKRANSESSYLTLSWQAVSNLMTDMGHSVYDYEDFKAAYNSSPALQSIVKNYNADGVTLKTKVEAPKPDGIKDPDQGDSKKTVNKMAKRATKRRS